ncbi:MAG: TonB-dependent receptor [Saprospiraceae bacterium]
MKLTTLLILGSVLQIWAADTYAQAARLTLHLENTRIEQVLKAIEDQSEFFFLYSPKIVDVDRRVEVKVQDQLIVPVLEKLFAGTGTKYVVKGRQIVLSSAELIRDINEATLARRYNRGKRPEDVAFEIRGTVKDDEGLPLIGVNILEKGTSNGTVTDFDGNYSLSVASGEAILQFSYTGFIPQEISVNNRQVIDLELQPDVTSLEEVVVVGYGTQKKSDVTGSLVSTRMDKFEDLPNYNVFQALQGSVPGLAVRNPDRPGEDPGILIRGTNSLSAGNSPLIVVDGIIFNGSLNHFDNKDIASVDVLKDASAAAIYGARAANGVILITTKGGTTDKPTFNFNTSHGFSDPVYLVDVLDGPGYIQKILDFREASGLEADPNNIEAYLSPTEAENYRNGRTINWFDELIQTGMSHSYHLDVSGRTDKTNYYLAGTAFSQEGIVPNDNFQRLALKANFSNDITDWYTIKLNTAFSSLDYSGIAAELNYTYGLSPYGSFWEDEERGIYKELPHEDPLGVHPLLNTLYDDVDIRNSFLGTLSSQLDFPFIPGLSWTLNYSANLRNRKFNQFFSGDYLAGRTSNGRASKYFSEAFDWTFDNFLTYQRTFNGRHSVHATVLYSREAQRIETSELNGNDFFTQQLGYHGLGIAAVQTVSSDYSDQNSVAVMGRLNYSFDNRYAVTATMRRDGYSGFGRGNKYASFPSVGLSWTLSNESFMQEGLFDLLKLRISFGKNGNQAVGRYQSLARIGNSQYVFGNTTVPTTYSTSLANTALSWETTKVINGGVDFGILNGRLRGSVDIYSSETYDLLLQRSIPETSGFASVFTNLGQVHNHGVEIALNSTNSNPANPNWSWESGFTFSLNRNRIEALTGIDADNDGIEDDDISNSWFIGYPVDVYYGYQVDGIYQIGDEIPDGFQAGEYRLKDTDGVEGLTADDRTILGSSLPNYTFSISNTLRFKNFSLYVLINSIQGGGKYNYYMGDNIRMYNVNGRFSTWSERFNFQDVPYWTPNNPSNEYPIINYVPSRGHPVLEDRSFVRLQDVSLSYNFDQDLLSRLGLQSHRLYVTGKNQHTRTKWSGYDPENATTVGNFPMLRTFTLGADLRF